MVCDSALSVHHNQSDFDKRFELTPVELIAGGFKSGAVSTKQFWVYII